MTNNAGPPEERRVVKGASVMPRSRGGEEDIATFTTHGGAAWRHDGSFTLVRVTPGAYTIVARFGQGPPGQGGPRTEGGSELAAELDVDVNGVDLDGLVLRLHRGGSLRGRVRFATPAPEKLGDVQLRTVPLKGNWYGEPPGPVSLSEDGSFQIAGLRVRVTFTLSGGSSGAPGTGGMARIEVRGPLDGSATSPPTSAFNWSSGPMWRSARSASLERT